MPWFSWRDMGILSQIFQVLMLCSWGANERCWPQMRSSRSCRTRVVGELPIQFFNSVWFCCSPRLIRASARPIFCPLWFVSPTSGLAAAKVSTKPVSWQMVEAPEYKCKPHKPQPVILLSTLSVPSRRWWTTKIQTRSSGNSVRMAFLSCFRGSRPGLPVGLFDSGAPEALARCEWNIYVSLSALSR